MKGKEQKTPESTEVKNILVTDLKYAAPVVLHDPYLELDVVVDGGFIRRLSKELKKQQREVQLTVIAGTIIAVCVVAKHLRRGERK